MSTSVWTGFSNDTATTLLILVHSLSSAAAARLIRSIRQLSRTYGFAREKTPEERAITSRHASHLHARHRSLRNHGTSWKSTLTANAPRSWRRRSLNMLRACERRKHRVRVQRCHFVRWSRKISNYWIYRSRRWKSGNDSCRKYPCMTSTLLTEPSASARRQTASFETEVTWLDEVSKTRPPERGTQRLKRFSRFSRTRVALRRQVLAPLITLFRNEKMLSGRFKHE